MLRFSGISLKQFAGRVFRKINAPYRLTIINEDSMTEAMTIHLTKKSVYIFLSTVFVSIFLLFSALLLFTPLKYYVPGANQQVSREKLIQLQKLSDSLNKLNTIREAYIFNLMRVAGGHIRDKRDTLNLSEKQIDQANRQNLGRIDHASRYDYLRAMYKDSTIKEGHSVKDSGLKK